jgi:hypothetical protein
MENCRGHFKDQILSDIKSIVVGKAKTYSVNDTEIFIPFNKDGKIKNKRASHAIAKRKVAEINKRYYSKSFGDVVSVNNGYNNGSAINIHIPNTLIDAYVRKYEEEEAREQQRQDAIRAGQDYSDEYMFDDLPANADGYNYGIYLDNKTKMRDFFNQRIAVLEQMSNKTKKDYEQIQEFKNIARTLSRDINNLEREAGIIDNVFGYFNADLDIIEEILIENPTLENLNSARNFIDMLKDIYDVELPLDERFSEIAYTELKESNPEVFQMFEKFISRYNTINDKLKKKELSTLADYINSTYQEQVIDADTEDFVKQIKDIPQLSALLLPIDGDSSASIAQEFIRKVYDDAVGKTETFELRNKLINLKPKIEAELKRLGYTNNDGVLGNLFSSVSYDIFFEGDYGRNVLTSKFSSNYNNVLKRLQTQFDTIESLIYKKNKDIQDYNQIKQNRKAIFNDLKNDVNFIDPRKLPELIEDSELQANFGQIFKRDEAEAYKEELIQSMISESGNRQVAERIYKKMIQEQKDKIYAFEIGMEQYKNRLLKRNGVSDIRKLPEADRNRLLSKFYTESPFAFAEGLETTGTSNVGKIYYKDGEQKMGTDVSTMEFVSFLPKPHMINQDFVSNIESNPTLYKAWEMFDDGLKYINDNRKYDKSDYRQADNSITSSIDLVREHNDSIISLGIYKTKELGRKIASLISTSRYVDTKQDMKLNGSIRSIDEVVRSRMRPQMAVMAAAGYKPRQVVSKFELPDSLRESLETQLGRELPPSFVVEDQIRKMTEEKVLNSQKLDFVDTIKDQLEVVEQFKAKKEIEQTLLFARNQIENVRKAKDLRVKRNTVEIVNNFINKHLYGVNNRANWKYGQQDDRRIARLFSMYEREMADEIQNAITAIKELAADNPDPKVQEQATKDIAALKKILKSGGRVITTGSIFEAGLIRMSILVGLGLNVPSQIRNWLMGNISGRQNDGLEWTEGNFPKAVSYTRKWKIATRKLSAKEKKAHKLTNTLIDTLGIFQNSANELDRIKESSYQNKLLKFVSNPLHIVGEMEKTIQRPQILAMLGDVMITDSNGNEVPAFNVNDTSNPHPAFDLDSEGNIILKPGFDTEDNKNTWINRNSQTYADLFGESGRLPRKIAKINGDYRSTSSTLIKETSVGSLFMMFKTWLPAFVLRRYGKKDGVISNLIKGERGSQALSITSATAAMYAGIGAGVILSPMIGIGLAGAYLGSQKMKMYRAQEMSYLQGIMKDIQKSMFGLQFATNLIRTSGAVGAKNLQQTTDLIFGKRMISNDLISNIAGYKQLDNETSEEFEKNKARLQFLLTEASTTMTLLALKILVNAFLYPDEDEEKRYREEGIKAEPMVGLYYGIENMLTAFANDVNLLNDPFQASQTVLSGSMTNTYSKHERFIESVVKQATEGDYKRGPNVGKNRIGVAFKNTFVPRGLTDFTLGFSKIVQQDYQLKDPVNRMYMSDIDRYESNRIEQRTKKKLELEEYYKKNNPNMSKENRDKRIQRKLKREFPTISRYFNEDGSLKKNYKNRVERYE